MPGANIIVSLCTYCAVHWARPWGGRARRARQPPPSIIPAGRCSGAPPGRVLVRARQRWRRDKPAASGAAQSGPWPGRVRVRPAGRRALGAGTRRPPAGSPACVIGAVRSAARAPVSDKRAPGRLRNRARARVAVAPGRRRATRSAQQPRPATINARAAPGGVARAGRLRARELWRWARARTSRRGA